MEVSRKMEPLRSVHFPWKEVSLENNITWELLGINSYEGTKAGSRCKPSSKIMEVACITKSLALIFFFIFLLKLIDYIAKMTKNYTYDEWVIPQERKNHDRNKTTKPFFIPIDPKPKGPLHSDAFHCAKET